MPTALPKSHPDVTRSGKKKPTVPVFIDTSMKITDKDMKSFTAELAILAKAQNSGHGKTMAFKKAANTVNEYLGLKPAFPTKSTKPSQTKSSSSAPSSFPVQMSSDELANIGRRLSQKFAKDGLTTEVKVKPRSANSRQSSPKVANKKNNNKVKP